MKKDEVPTLAPYITNLEDSVFAIQGLQGLVGAVMARYSRAQEGLRETLLKEFLEEGHLSFDKAQHLIERVLIAYGDDSVGELEGAHLSFEGLSMVATKVIERRRIGGSPIEKSTRYVRFDRKDEQGRYRYVIPPELNETLADSYRGVMDTLFDGYGTLFRWLEKHLPFLKPMEDARYPMNGALVGWLDCQSEEQKRQFRKTYKNDLKTKACDVLRSFLPLSTKANVGLFGNGRFFQHLITKMLSDDRQEVIALGEKAHRELMKVIPNYVKRAEDSLYLRETRNDMMALIRDLPFEPDGERPHEGAMTLLEPDFSALRAYLSKHPGAVPGSEDLALFRLSGELNGLTAMLFEFNSMDWAGLQRTLLTLPPDVWHRIRNTYQGKRRHRRDRPERAIEWGYPHQFELITEWAVYKDLMRHRMGTILVQPMGVDLGFQFPTLLVHTEVESLARNLVAQAESLHDLLAEHAPEVAEYATLHGHRLRWCLGMNDRALMHLLELRTTPQGHPHYRKVAQEMHNLLSLVRPESASMMTFVNHEDVFWSRAESEARQREKEQQWAKRHQS